MDKMIISSFILCINDNQNLFTTLYYTAITGNYDFILFSGFVLYELQSEHAKLKKEKRVTKQNVIQKETKQT